MSPVMLTLTVIGYCFWYCIEMNSYGYVEQCHITLGTEEHHVKAWERDLKKGAVQMLV